jgi:hypothetical protein
MNNLVTILVACSALSASVATAHFESQRAGTVVRYANGTSAQVDCDAQMYCSVSATKDGHTWTLEASEMGGLVALPSGLVLLDVTDDGEFVAWVEVECEKYADRPPMYVCIAQLEVKDEKLVDTVLFKRTLIDDFSEVPLRAPSLQVESGPEVP